MKRLILLSKHLTPAAQAAITEMTGKEINQLRIAFCSNAADISENQDFVVLAKQELQTLGIKVTEFDLNQFCGKCNELEYFLSKFDAAFFSGGSVSYLNYIFHRTGLADNYAKLVEDGKIIHIGFSAGAMICEHEMQIAYIIDADHPPITELQKGLCLTPNKLHILPHYSDKPKYTKKFESIIKYSLQKDQMLIPLSNSQGIVIKDEDWEII